MPVPIIAAGVAAAASIGGAVISSHAQHSATAKATSAAQYATDTNNALSRDIYNQNKGILSPYIQNGYGANNALAGLLGLNPQMSAGGAAQAQIPGYAEPARGNGDNGGPPMDPMRGYGNDTWTSDAGGMLGGNYTVPADQALAAQSTPAQSPGGAASPYEQAFANYRNSTGYQFRLGEGMNALNSGYAARGALQSGAAQKAALNYGQNIASNEFGNYLGYLGQQQGVGLSAGNALAGVGTNYAGMVSNNNNNLASVQANAALANGQSTANMWGNIAGGIGQFAGAFGSSYGGPSKSTSILRGKI